MKKPRVGTLDWFNAKHGARIAVYNRDYLTSGERCQASKKPWQAIADEGDAFTFATHAEAIAYAFTEAAK